MPPGLGAALESATMGPEILDSWRIDDEWWRKQPVSRLYYRVLLEDGMVVGLFKDLVSGEYKRDPGWTTPSASFEPSSDKGHPYIVSGRWSHGRGFQSGAESWWHTTPRRTSVGPG